MFGPRLIRFVCLFGWSIIYSSGYSQGSLVSVAKAGAKGELVFHPGRHLTRDEILRYLSEAAGESVLRS